MNFFQLIGNLETGIIYGLVAIGIYLTFRVLNFADLTVDGSFTLGAAVTASMLVAGYSPTVSTLGGFVAGGFAGAFTCLLYIRGNILEILTGILTMTGLYSINLRIMDSPNIGLINHQTMFGEGDNNLMILSLIVLVLLVFFYFLFKTNLGLSFRATGHNECVSSAYGVNNTLSKFFLISFSNALISLAGSLYCQLEGFADVSIGIGTVITGLASVVIGETIIKTNSLILSFVSCIIGAIVYRIIISYALNTSYIGLKSSDLSIITMFIVIFVMQMARFKFKKKLRNK